LNRSDHAIELWNIEFSPYLERTIIAENNSSIEGLEWCSTRLFSCGMQGAVLEYNLRDGCVKVGFVDLPIVKRGLHSNRMKNMSSVNFEGCLVFGTFLRL